MGLEDPLEIPKDHIVFESPDRPFNTSRGSGDIFVGNHVSGGKVAVRRVRLSGEPFDDEDAIRVSHRKV